MIRHGLHNVEDCRHRSALLPKQAEDSRICQILEILFLRAVRSNASPAWHSAHRRSGNFWRRRLATHCVERWEFHAWCLQSISVNNVVAVLEFVRHSIVKQAFRSIQDESFVLEWTLVPKIKHNGHIGSAGSLCF
jgi:hypothetical protein